MKGAKNNTNVRKAVKAILASQQELKFNRVAATSQTASTSSTVFALTQAIVQGDTQNSRDGSQVIIKHFEISVQVENSTLITAGLSTAFRMIVFIDRFNQGANVAATDLLVASSVISSYQLSVYQSKRFKILYDVRRTLSNGSETNGQLMKFDKKMSHKITYNGTTDAAGSNGPGSLWVLFVTDEATNPPLYSFDVVTRFTDS